MPLLKKLDESKSWREQDLGGVRPHPSVCFVRYGALGDMIQVSPLWKYYKEQGYYVTVNCHDTSAEYIKNDPYIDEIFTQKKDQVKQVPEDKKESLGEYWYNMSHLFDKYINLSSSVEDTLLVTDQRLPFTWPKAARHFLFNRNYLELAFLIAEIPWTKFSGYTGKFYPTEKEQFEAQKFINRIKKGNKDAQVVLWSMTGSALHKVSPWIDQVVARFMIKNPDIHFILTGDNAARILQNGWQYEKRVHMQAGGNLRNTLAMLDYVDVVIGPETGVLNAAGGIRTPSILLCSHSNPNKVSKYWKNNINLEPKDCDCYPCHILFHSSMRGCHFEEDTHAAMCTYNISPDMIEKAIDKQLKKAKRLKK